MVRALVDGRKTETRRPVTSQLAKAMPGDHLWVRETWHVRFCDEGLPSMPPRSYHDTPKDKRRAEHAQDIHFFEEEMRKEPDRRFMPARWIPSIHMNRWASRLTLVVKDLRFCRLRDISEAEAIAGGSGAEEIPGPRDRYLSLPHQVEGALPGQFGRHWDSLYRKPGNRLADNPEVVSLRFSVHDCNVDEFVG